MVIYLDESGDLGFGTRGARFLIIAILAPQDRRQVGLCVKKIRQRKLRKKPPLELKAFGQTNAVREALLKCVGKQDVYVYSIVVDKYPVTMEYRKNPNALYNDAASIVIRHCLESQSVQRLVVDKRGDKITRDTFNEYIWSLYPCLAIEHLDSRQDKVLQALDFVAWSIHRKFESEDTRFYNLIVHRIESEVFWEWA